jgi:hypothetical protein
VLPRRAGAGRRAVFPSVPARCHLRQLAQHDMNATSQGNGGQGNGKKVAQTVGPDPIPLPNIPLPPIPFPQIRFTW